MKYLDSHHILCDQQNSFRKRQLSESQLLTTIYDLASRMEKRQQINAILLGFSMAFDKMAHQCLAIKLHHFRVWRQTAVWARGYKAFFMLISAEHEISNAHKYKNIKKFCFLQAQIRLYGYFSCCWHFNIYEQERFHAQLS